jgi:hypothetical protein
MEIKYLKKMLKTPVIDDEENEGISEVKINEIEQAIGKKFPTAFREFLYLGGNDANMIADMNNGCFIGERNWWKEMQQNCTKEIKEEGVEAEKDFWAFAELDGGEQFHFIYFDDGEDPPVYYYCSYHDNEDFTEEYAGIIKMNEKFSDYVNEAINDKKKSGY